MGTLKAFINSSFQEINKVGLQIWLYTKTTTSTKKKTNLTTCPFELGLLRFYILTLTFPYLFLFFLVRMNSNCTVHAQGFTVQETKGPVYRT